MTLLNRLVEILNKEYKCYQQLLEIAKKKKKSLINNNVEALLNYINEDKSVIEKVENLEETREDIVIEVKKKYGIDEEVFTYTCMIEKLPVIWKVKLSSLRNSLLVIIEEFHNQNEQNKMLLKEALKLNKFSVDTILDSINTDSGIYNNKDTHKNSPRLLDKKG